MVRQNCVLKGILKECIRSYFLHGSMFCLGIYMSVSKQSICFCKWVILIKCRNKLFIHNINLTGHRKRACCLQLLVFLEVWVIAQFWHWRTQVFPKGALLLLKYRKWFSHLKNRYHYAKVIEIARITFLISPHWTLLLSKKENFKFWK